MRLRTLQRRKKMSMVNFANFIGVSQAWLSMYYHGIIPSGRLAIQISKKLEGRISVEEIISMNGRGAKFSIYG